MDGNPNFKLSPDIVMHVLQYLDPVDILAMRATCRFFYRTAASRSVWLAALDRVCEQHGIYKPTYPVEKMTLAELEHAALGPHRFIKSIDRAHSKPSEGCSGPYLTRQFLCRKRANGTGVPNGVHKVSRLALVPGGRFLFTAAGAPFNSTASIVCLWDLGYNMHSPIKPYPIASVAVPVATLGHLSTSPSSRGKRIDVAIYGYSHPTDEGILRIYSIDPTVQTPDFTLEDELPISHPTYPQIYLNGPTAVIVSESFVHVWNRAERKGCRWQYAALEGHVDILVCNNTIITLDAGQDFLIWDIPSELSSIDHGRELPLVSNPPKCVRRQHEDGIQEFTLAVTPSWQRHVPPHLCFVVNEDENLDHQKKLSLYSVRRMGSQDAEFIPTYLPVAAGGNASMLESIGRLTLCAVTPLFLCDGRLVLCSCSGSNDLCFTAFSVPTTASDDPLDLHSSLAVQEVDDNDVAFDFYNVGFCPMSGRVVHPLSDTSLQICDFLLPLEDR